MSAKENKSVIKRLENVQVLLYEEEMKNAFLEYESDMKFAEKTTKLKTALGDLEIPSVFSSFPIFPKDPSYCAAVTKDKEGKEKIFRIVLIATVALLVLYFITHWNFLNTVSVIGIFATAVLGYFYNLSRKEYNKKKSVYDKSVEKFNKTNKEFLSALEIFEEEKEACVMAAKEYANNYAVAYDKFLDEFVKKVDDDIQAKARIEEIEKELSKNDIITPEYYHLIDDIISNLKSGRAEDYKEALNMAIREEKEENERRIRLEQEEQRNMLLAMQAEEERRHNEQMERQQREHDAAVLREQKRQNDEIVREQRQQAYEAKRQEEFARNKAMHRCSKCKKRFACGSNIGIPNCGAFEPD